jgi:ADP-heptose:LPS heptosyltransferase
VLFKHPTWPSIKDHLTNRLDYFSHRSINDFFLKHSYLPRLTAPKGYENSMNPFREKKCKNRFIVSVNIRQRKLYPGIHMADSVIRRDSPLDEWHRFFKIVKDEYPEVVFLILGGYSTWERELYNYDNVLIPRTMGFGLAHELTLLHNSNLFLGTSSGFSAMATFSKVPYIITNFEHTSAEYVGLSVGASRYPFALDHQILSWEKETTELLLSLFGPMYESIRKH